MTGRISTNADLPSGLKRFLRARQVPPPGSACDMCAEPFDEDRHSHVVNLDSRALMCTCRACYLLFTSGGAGGGRFRVVPDRIVHDRSFLLTEDQWNRLQIPVSMAFFFRNSTIGRVVAFYPSPGGATESALPLDAWDEIERSNDILAEVEDDVEALLVRKHQGRFQCFIVPIDRCYELVGLVRRSWKGFDGGPEVWASLDAFFEGIARIASRSET